MNNNTQHTFINILNSLYKYGNIINKKELLNIIIVIIELNKKDTYTTAICEEYFDILITNDIIKRKNSLYYIYNVDIYNSFIININKIKYILRKEKLKSII